MKAPARFLIAAAGLEIVFFALLQAAWLQRLLLVPFTNLQGAVAEWYTRAPALPVSVTLSCSGADAIALALGAILAYPVSWRRRLAGSAGVVALIVPMNLVRIGTLASAAGSPRWFTLLHVYAWPSILTIAIAVYFLGWIRQPEGAASSVFDAWVPSRDLRRFVLATGALLLAFGVLAPWIMSSRAVYVAGTWVARWAADLLTAFGLSAVADGNDLLTSRGSFLVTQACIATPLIPVYVAGVLTAPVPRLGRGIGVIATVPLFMALGVVRLLALALPPALATSPLFVAHAFYQLLVFPGLVLAAARWARTNRIGRIAGARSLARETATACLVALGCAAVGGWLYLDALLAVARAVHVHAASTLTMLVAPGDSQGALAVLPVYQASLLVALVWVLRERIGGLRLVAGLAIVFATQLALLMGLGHLHAAFGLDVHVLVIRAWAVAVPAGLVLLLVATSPADTAPPGGPTAGDGPYRRFWEIVGNTFPDLGGAASTRYYLENEQRLFNEYLPELRGQRLFKTDLWDEAKNTRILQWAAARGARPIGIDISRPILMQARREFGTGALGAAQADVRALPFRDASIDAIYSMGTIEHFDESAAAIHELYRVLRPGGRAIVGVPNRHDPFLRPLLVTALSAAGLYGYGYERSFSRRALRALLEPAGFRLVGETAILFLPGWLRMADLACHCWCRPLSILTAWGIRPFQWLDRRVPFVRRHGYLVVAIVERPVGPAGRAGSSAVN